MKTNVEKQMNGAKEPGVFRVTRSRVSKKRIDVPGIRDLWRALSSDTSMQTPVLRRLRD